MLPLVARETFDGRSSFSVLFRGFEKGVVCRSDRASARRAFGTKETQVPSPPRPTPPPRFKDQADSRAADPTTTRAKALTQMFEVMGAVPGNRTDRWLQATFATDEYPVATATSLKYSALNANRSIRNIFDFALDVTLTVQGASKASPADKADLLGHPSEHLAAFAPQIRGIQHSSFVRAGVVNHRISVGFVSAKARDSALTAPLALTWHSAKAHFAKAHHFYHNMVELRINVGVAAVPSRDAIVDSFKSRFFFFFFFFFLLGLINCNPSGWLGPLQKELKGL
ncbi:BZ3501_MvSof-1269-A2-R1_C66g00372 [Microbotryum saponariae]|nr:BZ3501_MvSof-1269-A2-R1_C66g00372 [Microbotryum saponariae]